MLKPPGSARLHDFSGLETSFRPSTPARLAPQHEAEMISLREENARLREVEEQFWPLLRENEELRGALTQAQQLQLPGQTPEEPLTAPEDRDECGRALRECLELLLDQEAGGTARSRQLLRAESVASFLLWRRARLRGAAGTSSPRGDEVPAAERLKGELREAREMLNLATASRAQALEDCARMSAQVTELTQHLQSVLAALNEARVAIAEHESLRVLVDRQARDIRVRDELLAEMRETLQRMRAARCEQEISLELEAERAREQLIERQRARDS